MAIPTWQPGRLYQPGDIVLPITMPAPTAAQVENGDFSAGNVNWDYTGGAQYSATGGYGNRGPCVLMPGSVPEGLALNKSILVLPQNASTFEASAMIQQGASIAGATRGWVEVRWFDADGLLLDSQRGNIVSDGSGGAWHKSTVTATRPAGAAYARAGIGLFSVADHSHEIFGDNLTVSGTFAGLPDGLVYKAVQAESGFSANTEPKWPPILGQTVVDNDVTWEAVASTRVTWEASPLYVSGTTEPDWPTDIGGYVRDGTIDWKAVSRRVEDANCPDSNIVAIAASKVFAGDDDIVRYSATVNPLDWTTADDAGYLPTGLQNYGSNPVAAMGLYRGNLAVFNAEGFQLWQVDEDPASMALIDALPLGSTEHRSVAPVANDLLFATSLGIRSLGVSASSTNYQAGDVGAPIDTLVKDALRVAKQNRSKVLATYFPGAGQYLLSFSGYPADLLNIEGSLPDSLVGEIGTYQYVVTGGVLPRMVTISEGSLPPGASISESGLVTFAYTTRGSYSWTVRVTDHDGAHFDLPDSSVIGQENVWNSALVPAVYTLSNSTKTVTQSSGGTGPGNQISVSGRSSGKWYFEVQGSGQFENTPTGIYGIGPAGFSPNGGSLGSVVGRGAGMGSHGFAIKDNVTATRIAAPYPGNRRCMVAFDADTGRLWFGVAGVWVKNGNPATGANPFYTMSAGTYFPMVSLGQIAAAYTLITKPSETQYQPPVGFSRWLQQ